MRDGDDLDDVLAKSIDEVEGEAGKDRSSGAVRTHWPAFRGSNQSTHYEVELETKAAAATELRFAYQV